jgi:large subunit ribosomal protein L9
MKVILLKDIDKLGKKYDIKVVKTGFAMNSLIPKGLVKPATKLALMNIDSLKKKKEEGDKVEFIQTQKIASELDGQEIEFFVKTGEDKQLFEAITPPKIVKKLQEIGFNVKKDQIILEKPIKELGEFSIKINLDHQLEAKILVIIESEKEEEVGKEI